MAERIRALILRVSADNDWKSETAFSCIILSIRTIELVWALSYAYVFFYETVVADRRPTAEELDLRGVTALQPSRALLSWAKREFKRCGLPRAQRQPGEPWPAELAPPPRCLRFGRAAAEITLCALAWIILHEIGHAERDNDPPADWIIREGDLDSAATDWLRGLPQGDPAHFKRGLGISVALIAMTAHGIHTGCYDGQSHPFTYDRLIEQIERYTNTHEDKVWAFVVAILALHMTDESLRPPPRAFDTFYECARAYRDVLAQQGSA